MLDKDELTELISEYMETVPMGPSGDDDRPWNSGDMAAKLLPRIEQETREVFSRIEGISNVIDWAEDIGEMREMKESDYQTLKKEYGEKEVKNNHGHNSEADDERGNSQERKTP